MSKFAVQGPEIKKLLVKAKEKPVAFAYAQGKTPAEDYFGMDRLKEARLLHKEAKAEKKAKAAAGTLSLEKRDISLTCEQVLPNLARNLKKHLKVYKLSYNIIVLDETGAILEQDVEELEDADDETTQNTAPADEGEAPEAPPAPQEVDTDQKAWLAERIKALVPEVKKFASVNKQGGPRVVEALKAAQAALAKNDLVKAEKAIVGLEKLLRVTPPPKAPPLPPRAEEQAEPTGDIEAARRQVQEAFDRMEDDLRAFLKRAAPSHAGKASQLEAAFRKEIAGTDMKQAAKLVSALKKFVDANLSKLPPLSEAEKAKEAIAGATGPAPASRYEKAAGIQDKYAKGAVAARQAMDGFAAILGDQPATDDLIKQAKTDIDTAQQVLEAAQKRLERAQALPDGEAKTKAIAEAQTDLNAAEGKLTDAKAFHKAARGQKALTDALSFGPLSANSGQSFSDEAAEALIAGFARDPELTVTAVEAATTGKYPDAVAQNLAEVIDRKEGGFAGGGQTATNQGFIDGYAENLLKMGANTGPDFFARMPDYLDSGRLFTPDPLGENGIGDKAARAQIRSVAVGGALLDTNGQIDTTSQNAKDAVGDLLFSPWSMQNPTPALNEHVLETLKTFSDPTTGPQANAVLAGVPDTTPANAQGLVRKSLRKADTDAVDKSDVQKAVMASMLKPLDQGPVGSCFSTAPCRRMRETDPIEAMKAYASIAGTGKYKPANGPEVPAVTRIPANEDPIMRSWEYSMATSTARTKKSSEQKEVKRLSNNALNFVGGAMNDHLAKQAKAEGGIKGFAKEKIEKLLAPGRLKELKRLVNEGYDLVYDPNSTIVAASDGKSSTGRYVLKRKDNGAEITTQEQWGDYVADQAIAAFGVDATSTLAAELRALCKRQDVLDATKSGDTAPWAMSSGGQTEAATQTLFGSDLKQRRITKEGKSTDDKAERTKQILKDMLGNFDGSTDEMITVRTVGMHGFNAMPNDPSLEPLTRGGKSKLAENIQRELVEPGEELRDKTFSAEKTVYLYNKISKSLAAEIGDRNIRKEFAKELAKHVPTDGKTTAEIAAALEAGVTAARPHYPTGKEDVWENFLKKKAHGKSANAVLQDAGAPQFVIADSNWGSSTDHTFFVIAADPISGEPTLYEKTVPPGSLSPSGRDWTDAEWAAIR